MQKIKNNTFELIPLYGRVAIYSIVVMNVIVYYGSRLFTRSMYHFNFTSSLDDSIPFVPAFILVYTVVAYGQWFYGYILSARECRRTVMFIFGSELVAKTICMMIFFALPTTMDRGIVNDTNVFGVMVGLLYSTDTPDNLFPSIHCLESYLLLRTVPLLKNAPVWYKRITPLVTLLVFASVLLVKQHVVLDVLGAIIVTEIGMLVMKCIVKVFNNNIKRAEI